MNLVRPKTLVYVSDVVLCNQIPFEPMFRSRKPDSDFGLKQVAFTEY